MSDKCNDQFLGSMAFIAAIIVVLKSTPQSAWLYYANLSVAVTYGLLVFGYPLIGAKRWHQVRVPFILCTRLTNLFLMESSFIFDSEVPRLFAIQPHSSANALFLAIRLLAGTRLLNNFLISTYIPTPIFFQLTSNLLTTVVYLYQGEAVCATPFVSSPVVAKLLQSLSSGWLSIVSQPGLWLSNLPPFAVDITTALPLIQCRSVYSYATFLLLFILPAYILCRKERRNECFQYALKKPVHPMAQQAQYKISNTKTWLISVVYPDGNPAHYVGLYLLFVHLWVLCCFLGGREGVLV